jgi:carbonic anhydrase/acetyltransferase-like protein (isoleucine patch superfamily)
MPIFPHHGVLPSLHSSVYVAAGAFVIGAVNLCEDVSVWFNAVLRGDINEICVGRRTNIQDGAVVHVTKELAVNIGEEVTVGHRALVHGCTIGSATLVGMGAVILDEAMIGEHCLIAAGAVVRQRSIIPPGTLAAGVPARVVRELTDEERQLILQSAHNYIDYARSFTSP